jgi:RNA polymerase-binding transcription factor DksA
MATKTKKAVKTAKKPVKSAATKTKKSVKTAKKAAPAKSAKKAPVKAKAAPKKATKSAAKPAKPAKPIAKAVKAVVTTVKEVVKSIAKPAPKSSLVAKPVGTKAIPKRGAGAGRRNGSQSSYKAPPPPRAGDIPVRTVKVPQPAIKVNTADPSKTRYSDQELAEFKALIDEKLEAAKNELRYLQDQINRKDDNGTDDTENKFANLEDGSITMEREYLNQMAVRQAQYIDHLEKALMRIQNKTYGICRVTGKLIDKDRLRAVPHATLSMEAKLMQNR